MVKSCRRLVQLELKSCRISHPDVSFEQILLLAAAVLESPSLRKLDIVDCPKLGPKSITHLCEALKDTGVTHLSLEGVDLRNEGLKSLTQLLRDRDAAGHRIKALSLEGSIFHDRSTVATDEAPMMATTEPMQDIVWKDFVSVACQTLESLDLSRNQLSRAGQISDLANGISSRKSPCRLLALLLSNNPIGDSGMDILCQGLKRNRTMVLLACAECELSAQSSHFLTDALRSNPSLQRLYLYGNKEWDRTSTNNNEEWKYW
eukprot:CAMPEP_0178836686 /NCGR_PEP_ID=MMETSP0746-20121128/12341_1 /TAXON_ID=913974 /ORGANISM="Nitzschia punctata, Strain CCMP561" /LENGTH=260 /DNA_ID=CAMNT_0020499441 /DNA_START=1 /DNA_END=780 /DNA_ORIENTATION=+